MGIPSTMRDAWANRRNSHLIASPAEDQKILNSRRCTQEGVRAGVKAASIACVASAVPTLVAVRVIPWAKANLNYTAQALIISAGHPLLHTSSLLTKPSWNVQGGMHIMKHSMINHRPEIVDLIQCYCNSPPVLLLSVLCCMCCCYCQYHFSVLFAR
ncbi:unnamed protein product [Camellia sinensis]